LILGLVGLVALAVLGHATPAFFRPDGGEAPLRRLVLTSAVAMFMLAAVLRVATSRRPLSAFAHWYALALGLIATGLFGVTVQSSSASLLGWVGHTAAYLGGLCLLVAAVASVRESRVWGMSLQASLRESEEKFRAMADTSQAAISLYQDGHVIYANHASEFVFGYSLDERRGMDFLELLHPDFRQRAGERMKAILENGSYQAQNEYKILGKDGQERWVLSSSSRLTCGGKPAVMVNSVDITERKRTEETLRELNATLESKVAERTAELEHRARQLQRLTLELSQAEEQERRRIAVLLHEDVQQQIVGARLHLNLLNGRAEQDEQQIGRAHV
jgi:PAS domain S-box-containing protein